MARISLILAALCALAAPSAPARGDAWVPSDPCTLCTGTKQVTCPTCAGRGRASIECQSCRGVGRTPCLACKIPSDVIASLPVKVKRGWLPCPNRDCDKKGFVPWETGSKDLCRVCEGKGTSKCPMCSEGAAPCSSCAGKGRLEATCRDCAGSGKLPCPGCTATAKSTGCPLCHNARKRACELCKPGAGGAVGSGATVKCTACAGAGTKPCQECRGFGRSPCDGCGGTGVIRLVEQISRSKAGKKTHDACQGTGWLKCDVCKSGRVDCGKCKNGNVSVTCSGCRDTKVVVCHGCLPGSWSGFETCGRILHAASRFDDALAFYSRALSLASAPMINPPDDPELKRSVDAWLKDARTRIEAEIGAAEAKKPPPAGKS